MGPRRQLQVLCSCALLRRQHRDTCARLSRSMRGSCLVPRGRGLGQAQVASPRARTRRMCASDAASHGTRWVWRLHLYWKTLAAQRQAQPVPLPIRLQALDERRR